MTRQQIFSIVFFALLVLLFYQIGLMLRPFLFPALWAGLLVHWAFPLHFWLPKLFGGNADSRRVGHGRRAVGCHGGMLVREAGVAEQAIRTWIAAGGLQQLPDHVATIPLIGGWLRTVISSTNMHALSRAQPRTSPLLPEFFHRDILVQVMSV